MSWSWETQRCLYSLWLHVALAAGPECNSGREDGKRKEQWTRKGAYWGHDCCLDVDFFCIAYNQIQQLHKCQQYQWVRKVVDESMHAKNKEWVNEWMDGWTSEWLDKPVNDLMAEQTSLHGTSRDVVRAGNSNFCFSLILFYLPDHRYHLLPSWGLCPLWLPIKQDTIRERTYKSRAFQWLNI